MILGKIKIVTITLLTLLGTLGTPNLFAETRDSAPPRIETVDSSPELIPTAPSKLMSLFDATIYDGQTYIFRCRPLKVAGEYRDTIQRVSGGDSILVLTLHVTPPTEKKVKYTATIEDGESYLFGCELLTAAGVYKDTLESAAGLDSIVTLTLNVTPATKIKVKYTADINPGETYLFGCEMLTAAGEYKDTLESAAGLDSIVTLTLNVKAATKIQTKYTADINPGETYLFGCEMLTAAGEYKDTLESAAGLDSIVTLTLNVKAATKIQVKYSADIEAGETYLFGCELLTAAGEYKDTLESAAGLDSIVALTLNVKAPTAIKVKYSADIEAGETYLFGCELLTAAGEYKDTLESAAGLDSIVTLTLNVKAATKIQVKYSADIEAGETYLFGCELLTAAGEYKDTLESAAGLDSIVALTLNVKAPTAIKVKYTADIEAGETYLFGCELLTAAGEYKDTLESAAGLDSIVTLTLNVKAPTAIKVQYSTTIEVDDYYLFGCELYHFSETGPQVLRDTLESAAGLDSIVIVNLTVAGSGGITEKSVKYTADITAGETYLFGCELLTAAGVYKDTLESVDGLDSIVVLTLNVNALTEVKVKYTADIKTGETYLFGCELLTAAGEYKDTLESVAGLDSIVILTLNVNAAPIPENKVKYTADINAGETYLFGCELLTAAGEYTDTLQGATGDSIVVLTLNVNALTEIKVKYSTDITEGETYLFGCELLTAAGEYTDTLESVAGLDSIVILTLNVNAAPIPENKVKYSTTIEAGETYLFGCELLTATGEYKDTLVSAAGNDSIVILTLTVNTVPPCTPSYGTDTIEGCDSVTFKGIKYIADTIVKDTIVAGAVSGCDSIVTVTITVHHSTTGTDTIEGCDLVTFKGKNYTADATVQDTLTGVNGCDSIVTVTITVHHSVTAKDTIEGCESVTFKGKEYTADATVLDTLTTVNGCDSIVTVTITVKHGTTGQDAISGCGSVTFKGKEYTADATVLDTLVAANGCDSIVTVTITVKQPSVGDTTAVECDKFIWYEHTITASGDYTHTFENAVGCDSVVTLHATINKSASSTMEPVSECNKYYWESADTLITTSGTYTHVFQTVNGCDSVVSLTAEISVPYETMLTLVHKFGNRLLMIHRNEINSLWENFHLDSLDIEHPEYVIWHQIDLAGKDSIVGQGYTYSLESGDPLPTGYSYYAIIEIPAGDGNCGAEGKTMIYTIPAPAGAPALMPSLARPGEDIKIINLDPDVETTIRIFTAEGSLQRIYTVSGEEHFTIKAARGQGFYLVEVIADNMKSTLRYIVQ